MKKPTNKAECEALIKELQEMTFNELPKRWDELDELKGYYICSFSIVNEVVKPSLGRANQNTFPTSEQAEASIYLAMLMQLRDVYREGWVSEWIERDKKYVVRLEAYRWSVIAACHRTHPFSFQTQERAELFLDNFGDYLEKVKPLFS